MYKNAPVVYRSSEEIRELIIDWVERNKTIPVAPNNNWRIIPVNDASASRSNLR
jgi:2',3'-cyclic-nucleotide 2'-phosphodiesterase/3'-nucleotidase